MMIFDERCLINVPKLVLHFDRKFTWKECGKIVTNKSATNSARYSMISHVY